LFDPPDRSLDNLLDGRLAMRYLRDNILSLTGRQVKTHSTRKGVMVNLGRVHEAKK
jgi:hypothetical protein